MENSHKIVKLMGRFIPGPRECYPVGLLMFMPLFGFIQVSMIFIGGQILGMLGYGAMIAQFYRRKILEPFWAWIGFLGLFLWIVSLVACMALLLQIIL